MEICVTSCVCRYGQLAGQLSCVAKTGALDER